jgi:LPPG:FO 2-phospho-L-lactate transferase
VTSRSGVAVISGGVGAARLLRGIVRVVEPRHVTAIVNTGDDTELHGLHIAPDLDTITYTVAGAVDADRGWGLAGETWTAMAGLERYAAVRPPGSVAAPIWFNLGDRDLATHLYRTARLGEGATLTDVTAEIARAWGLEIALLPMSDDRLRTMVTVAGHGEIAFQDYFVRLRHDVAVEAVRFDHDDAALSAPARAALESADVVVIAPSNPIVSIGPIRAMRGVDDLLAERRESVVAVSPIVGGAALKGPADRMLTELGYESSVVGVAELYRSIAATLVIDRVDAPLASAVEAAGLRCVVAPSVMTTLEVATDLAAVTLAAGRAGLAQRS